MISALAFVLINDFILKRLGRIIFLQSKNFSTSQGFFLIREVFYKKKCSASKEFFYGHRGFPEAKSLH